MLSSFANPSLFFAENLFLLPSQSDLGQTLRAMLTPNGATAHGTTGWQIPADAPGHYALGSTTHPSEPSNRTHASTGHGVALPKGASNPSEGPTSKLTPTTLTGNGGLTTETSTESSDWPSPSGELNPIS